MKDKGMPKADFIMGLILMACSLLIVVESLKIPRFKKDWGGFYAAPGFVPLILGITLFVMSLALFVRAVKKQGYKIIPGRETTVILCDPNPFIAGAWPCSMPSASFSCWAIFIFTWRPFSFSLPIWRHLGNKSVRFPWSYRLSLPLRYIWCSLKFFWFRCRKIPDYQG